MEGLTHRRSDCSLTRASTLGLASGYCSIHTGSPRFHLIGVTWGAVASRNGGKPNWNFGVIFIVGEEVLLFYLLGSPSPSLGFFLHNIIESLVVGGDYCIRLGQHILPQ